MPAYVIVDITVKDPAVYEEYKLLAPSSIAHYEGRYLVRGGSTAALEGDWRPTRLVLLEFPTVMQARRWWKSPEYAAAKALRQQAASTEMLVVEGVASEGSADAMLPSQAIARRRSIKRFTDRPISRAELEALLELAVLAPNHRLTQPWRFYVLGPEARYAYGLALGERKARKLDDADAGRALRDAVAAEHRALPAMLAVATTLNDNPEIREEDYASAMMAVANLEIAAVERGLGTHIKSGDVMSDPAARKAVGVKDDERIVAIVNIGEPAEVPPAKRRDPASGFTTWVP